MAHSRIQEPRIARVMAMTSSSAHGVQRGGGGEVEEEEEHVVALDK